MAWKAALLGIKAVKLAGRGPLAMPEAAIAPRAAVSLSTSRVVEMFCGMVRKLSMTWMTPPVKLIFYSPLAGAWTLAEHIPYSLGDGRFPEQSRVEDHLFARRDSFDSLTRGQVRVCMVHERGRDECWLAGDVGGAVCAIKDVVGEEGVDERSVLSIGLGGGGARQKLREGIVVGSKERDVGQAGQRGNDLRKQPEVLCQIREARIAANGSCQVHCLCRAQRGESRQREELGVHFGLAVDWVVELISHAQQGLTTTIEKPRENVDMKKAVSEGERCDERADCQYFWPVWQGFSPPDDRARSSRQQELGPIDAGIKYGARVSKDAFPLEISCAFLFVVSAGSHARIVDLGGSGTWFCAGIYDE